MSKELEYRLPLNHIVADYEVKLDNVQKHPRITQEEKQIIEKKRRLFNFIRYSIVAVGLAESYRMYIAQRAGSLSKAREYVAVGRLIIGIVLGQYMNFNHLQYHTDFYIRKYGYMVQHQQDASDPSSHNLETVWDMTKQEQIEQSQSEQQWVKENEWRKE